MRRGKRNKIIIFILIGIVCLMGVGYAAFNTQLEIKGTSSISSLWDIRITDVSDGETYGSAESLEPVWDDLTANLEANLYNKGDYVEYEVTISNLGDFDAKLSDIITITTSSNEAILITFSGYTKGEILYKNSSQIITVKIEYDPDYEGTGSGSGEVEITFEYEQNEGGSITPTEDHLVTYDCTTNGGNDCSTYNEYVTVGESINLSHTATKTGYEFVGWNTNSGAKERIDSLTVSDSNITLYAIYKKDITVTYEIGDGVESIGKENDTCSMYNNDASCTITLPSITASTGYSIDGWYLEEENIGSPNSNYNVSSKVTLIAKGKDDIIPTTPVLTNSSLENWTNETVTITITASDEGSGIDHYEWYNNGTWTSENITIEDNVGTITFTEDMEEEIMFRAIDKAGNISETSTTSVKIDTLPPTCEVSGESSKWIALTQTITGICSDEESGCTTSQITKTYSIAEGVTGNYDNYYSPGEVSDNAGNVTECSSVQVRVTGTTIGDYADDALFMYDGQTGLDNSTWEDQSGNNRNGTLVGAVKEDNAVYCDGVDDYVRIAELNYQNVTLESSYMPVTLNKRPEQIIGNIEVGGYRIYISTNNYVAAQTYKNGGYSQVYSDEVVETNKAYYSAGRFNNSYTILTFGEETSSVLASGSITNPSNSTYVILCANPSGSGLDLLDAADELFNGYIYTARMYSRVLTDDELQKHYVIDSWRYNF